MRYGSGVVDASVGNAGTETRGVAAPCSTCASVRSQRNGTLSMAASSLPRIMILTLVWMALLTPVLPQLQGRPPTVFMQQPQAGIPEIKGNTKVLLCHASGTPAPVYRWLKDGEFLTESNITERSLKIQDIKGSDAGEYQCIGSNNYGALLSSRVKVHVAYLYPFANTLSQEKTVDQGQACIIDLPPIESFPPPNIQWFEGFNTQIPTESHRFHVSLSNQLIILETRLTDNNKVFKATAFNIYTSLASDSQTFSLKVQNVGSSSSDIPPTIVVPPSHTTAVQGDDVAATLECVANARSLNYLHLNWYRKTDTSRDQIAQDRVKYLFSRYRRRLTIKNPITTDSGIYECEATFERPNGPSFPSAVSRANLTVQVRPSFATPPPTELSQDYGSDVEIPCQAHGFPNPTIQWYRNAASIESGHLNRYTITKAGALNIKEVNPGDSGVFQCFVTNAAGEINAATWLQVLSSPPEIVLRPQNKSVIADDSAQLPCKVTGAPRPKVVWYRVLASGGSEDLTGSSGRIQVLQSELLITRAEVGDSGKYVCNATNSKGTAFASAHLRVLLRTRIVAPAQDASVVKGSTTVIQCGVSHDPSVRVTWTWYQGTVVIPPGETRRMIRSDGSLEIRSVSNNHIGQYRCDVRSIAGNDSVTANLKVIELPYPPSIKSVELNEDSHRAVDMHWNPGFDGNSPVNRFIVQFRLVPSGSEGWQVADDNVPPSLKQYTISNLLPARSYQFRVSAVNNVGEGPGSDPSREVELPQQPPSGPPKGVVGSPRSETSVILQWQPPDEDKWNGPLLGYTVKFKLSGYPDSTITFENVTSRLDTMRELKGLIVFQEYEIAVAAYNKKGVGVYSEIVRVRTMEGKPNQAPRNVGATAVNSTSIKMSWLPPNPQHINGINQGYKIEAQRVNVPDPEILLTFPSDTSNMLGTQTGYLVALNKFTEYSIRVLCFTSQGDGPKSPPVIIKTMEDVPSQVGSLTFKNILDTSLQVIWTPPPNINGILVGYMLTYMRKNRTISKVTLELLPNELNHTITGLTATTTYSIAVLAKTRVGAGLPRSADIESGVPPERPEPPRNLAITNIQASSVLLQFIPGFSGHTSITKWVIHAQMNGEEEWVVIFQKSAPEATSLVIENLRPYTSYVLRIIAENVAGRSEPSEPTRSFETIQAAPASPPPEVTVRADNETAIRVRWKPLSSDLWNGEGRGYLIQHKEHGSPFFTTTIKVGDENANSYTFSRLEEWTEYEVRVASFNKVGNSDYSDTASDRTRESVPSQGPNEVNATALSSTTISVRWLSIPPKDQNGQILGFKVLYSIANMPWLEPFMRDLNVSAARETILADLRKYTQYRIQVLAYTRIGDGAMSTAAPIVKTFEDVPGPPSSVYFPEVTPTTVRVVWSAPKQPNGIIAGYRVSYREKDKGPETTIEEDGLGPTSHELYVSHLQRRTYYVFKVASRTKLGWGEDSELEVFTIVDRTVPDAPTQPQIGMSAVAARWVTINWQQGDNGYGPVRNFTIQLQRGDEDWSDVEELVSHDALAFTVTSLKPNTMYMFRIAAVNDIGSSPFSDPSEQVTTKQAAPESPPLEVQVVPKTTTSVLITWKPPQVSTWNGDLTSYVIEYREAYSKGDWQSQILNSPYATSLLIMKLEFLHTYELRIQAVNQLGSSPWSTVVMVYLEMVPTEPPEDLVARVLSSTQVRLNWNPPPELSRNGDLLGYKVFYWVESKPEAGSQVKTVAATETTTVLDPLNMFTEYAMVILAFNAAGDGPNITVPVLAKTHQGVPSMPGELRFMVTSLTSVNVSWDRPAETNGVIEKYEVSYYQDTDVNGEKLTRPKRAAGETRSVQVTLSGEHHSYEARELTENVKYIFAIRGKTSVGWGEPRQGNITTGPQEGSPERPGIPTVTEGQTSVTLTWENGDPGSSEIVGYIIQAVEKGGDQWITVLRKQTPEPEAIISLLNLRPNSQYQFRVIALNDRGISGPSLPSGLLGTLKVDQKPFYQQWWFLIIVALTGVIFIIIVISLLCLTGRNKANKYKDPIPKTTIHLHPESEPASGTDDGGFATFEMGQAQRRSARRPPKTSLPPYSRSNYMSPPRPSPGSVNYSDGEESKYPDEESSSLTEKPSEISSSGSESQASESDAESEKELPPPPFPNHYANGNIQQSWNRTHTPSRSAAYNYTDSEPESQYAVTMNGGHVIMNNMAGSRAPLPGFSSFV